MDLFNHLSQKPALLNAVEHQFELCFTDLDRAPITPELIKQLIADYGLDALMARALIRFIRHAVTKGKSDTLLFQAEKKRYLLAVYQLQSNKFMVAAHDIDACSTSPTTDNCRQQNDDNKKITKTATTQVTEPTQSIDISDRTSISFLAFHDPLTFLPNRTLAIDRLKQSIANSETEQRYYSLIFIDVDDFKLINDSLGHSVGDEVLKTIACRLSANVRAKDTVARLGGDEFLIILSSLDDSLAVSTEITNRIVSKLSLALKRNILVDKHNIIASVSIGITLFKGQEDDVKNLMQQADMAMYQAKGNLKGSYEFFSEIMRDKLLEALELEQDLSQALDKNEFKLYFQPKVTDSYELVGAEALLRWQHLTKGLIYPKAFVAELESSNLIFEFGYWLIVQACEVLKQWQQIEALTKCHLSINISAKHFNDEQFSDKVADLLALYQIPKHLLIFEITETLLLENMDKAIGQLNKLSKLGVKFSIDDFGTGYSSLVYLKQLPIHEVKIDRSFIQNIVNDKADEMIVKTIVNLANNFQLSLIAEGVEQEEQVAKLTQLGCYQFQGFLYSKAIEQQEFIRFAQQLSTRQAALKNSLTAAQATGLCSICYLLSQCNYWLERHPTENLSMLVCHISNMKTLDAALALTVTEEVLSRATKRMVKTMPNGALIAQQQRGYFLLVLPPEHGNISHVSNLANSISNIVKRPILINGLVVHLEPMVEIAQYPKDGGDADTLAQTLLNKVVTTEHSVEFRESEYLIAMLKRQQHFKSSFALSKPDLLNGNVSSEFEIYYQPIINLRHNNITGVEVSAAWQPEGIKTNYSGEILETDEEQRQVLNTLTLWSTRLALKQFATESLAHLVLTIPILPAQLEHNSGFIDSMSRLISGSQRPNSSVRLELSCINTKLSSTINNAIGKLKQSGINLGLSGQKLSTLYHGIAQPSPFDYVKLTTNTAEKSNKQISRGLNKVVAETFSKVFKVAGIQSAIAGVNNVEDAKELKHYGVIEAQGSVYSQPLLFEPFLSFLSHYNNIDTECSDRE